MLSEDGKTGLIIAGISGGENGAQRNGRTLLPLLHDRDGVAVRAGGEVVTYIEANDQSKRDLLTMESIALPVSFRGAGVGVRRLLAAALPLAVGGFAIVGSMAVLRLLAVVHRRVDLRAEPDHRAGPGAGHRLHAADRQPVPR